MGFNELTQTEHASFIAGQGGNAEQSRKKCGSQRKAAF